MSDEKQPEVEVSAIPTEREFANNLAATFLQESKIEIEMTEDDTYIDAVLSIPDVNREFSMWLCALIRETSFEELTAPKGIMLN